MVATTTKTQNATMPRLGKVNLPNLHAVPPHHCEHLLEPATPGTQGRSHPLAPRREEIDGCSVKVRRSPALTRWPALPRKRRIPDNAFMSQPTGRPAPPSGLRVFVADDERALADLVGTYLTRERFEVSLGHDGQQAIEPARQVDPDVMVLDLGPHLIDGVQVWPRGSHPATSFCSPRLLHRYAHRTQRRGRQIYRPLGRGGRLPDQAVQPPRTAGPDPRDGAPSPRLHRESAALAGKAPECSRCCASTWPNARSTSTGGRRCH